MFALILVGAMMAYDMWNMIEDLNTTPVRKFCRVGMRNISQVCKRVMIILTVSVIHNNLFTAT